MSRRVLTPLAAMQAQRDDEAWKHAACLSIAEGVDGWDCPSGDESEAMRAVRRLRRENGDLRRKVAFLEQGWGR